MKRNTAIWIRVAAAGGIALAAVLLIETALTYRDSATRFARDQALLQGLEEVSSLEHQLSRASIETAAGLRTLLAQTVGDRSDEIAWMNVIDSNGRVVASSSPSQVHSSFPAHEVQAVLERGQSSSVLQDTAQGQVVVALVYMKELFQAQGSDQAPLDWRMLEIAIYLRGPEGVLHPLRRNLLIQATAAFALLASMIVFQFRLKAYVRGRKLENQLELARSVQRRLLPDPAANVGIEFAGECLPADEVSGDFYDVFPTARGDIALVLGDVSGKGLPAALRMGVVHGAIRALSESVDEASMARMASTLNGLLREEASREFVTLFWGFYNPLRHDLRYVNAGHFPPLLIARAGEVRRLETGGPVLGLLPAAEYQAECIKLDAGQSLIAYSDGLIEATNQDGEEFGESRLLPIARYTASMSASDAAGHIMGAALKFVEGREFHDDLSIFVARLSESAPRADTGG